MKNLIFIPGIIYFLIMVTIDLMIPIQEYSPYLFITQILIDTVIITLIILYLSSQVLRFEDKQKIALPFGMFIYVFLVFYNLPEGYQVSVYSFINPFVYGFIYTTTWILFVKHFNKKIFSIALIVAIIYTLFQQGAIYLVNDLISYNLIVINILTFPILYLVFLKISKFNKKQLAIIIILSTIYIVISFTLSLYALDIYTYFAITIIAIVLRKFKMKYYKKIPY